MNDVTARPGQQPGISKLLRGAIWIAIGALIAAALVGVVWVLIGDQDGLIGRAFLTILLLTAFAGIAVVESNLASRRPDWLVLASMASWIVALLVGAVKIWMPEQDEQFGWVSERFFHLLVVIGILQLALVHPRLYLKAARRYVTLFTRVIVIVTYVMLAALVGMLVFHLTFPDLFRYSPLYWRATVALAILAAVGTMLIPLLNALFASKPGAPTHGAATVSGPAPVQQPWPTYADGRTPLPVMPDGSPDWNAYHTGRPSYGQLPPPPVWQPSRPSAPAQPVLPPMTPSAGLPAAPAQPVPPPVVGLPAPAPADFPQPPPAAPEVPR